MKLLRSRWSRFWRWYDQFYLSGTPVLGPLTGGKWMQMSPKAVAANLIGLVSGDTEKQDGANQEGDYPEGCEIDDSTESHTRWRVEQMLAEYEASVEHLPRSRPIVTPEEFCDLVNSETRPGMTWNEAHEVLRRIEGLVELE